MRIINFKKFLIIDCLFMIVLAALWLFQTNLLAQETEKLSLAQERLAKLQDLATNRFSDVDLEIERLAQNYSFEKIDQIHYIKANINTALAK